MIRHDQQLSDVLIWSNLEQPPGSFYDPSGKRPRAEYRWYGHFFKKNLAFRRELHTELSRLIDPLRVERQRNR